MKQPSPSPTNFWRRTLATVLPFIVIAGVVVVGWAQRYQIYDWWRLRGYTPPAEVVRLADETSMTDYARRLFYANRPQLNDRQTFAQKCIINEASIVLGCYISSEGIYLFNVADERLAGVHEVTAAHEMLHAAYERLGGDEQTRIDELTQAVFGQLDDERLNQTIENYRQRDAGVVANELHSILATEVSQLNPELENYYSRYFHDRQKVVAFSQAYESAFQARRDQVAAYDRELSQLKTRIDQASANLDTQEAALSAERAELDQLLSARRFDEYNARVPGYNDRIQGYNSLVASTKTLIERYNHLIELRNSIALEENELLKALDSRSTIAPAE